MRRELMSLAANLPSFFNEVACEIRRLHEPLKYYENFRKYLHQENEPKSVLLPLSSLIITGSADATVYEFKRGKKPTAVERPPFESLFGDDSDKNGEDNAFDFGEGDGSNEIDFGTGEVAIDFGDTNGIQIEVVADDNGELDDGIARGEDALTLLEDAESQKLILSELMELETFLTFRRSDEMCESPSDIYISAMELRAENIRAVDVSQMDCWIKQIKEILAKLNDSQKRHLFKIRSSPHYVETLVESLEQKRSLEGRYERMRALMVERSHEVREAAIKAQAELKHVSDATRVLQKQIEDEISKKYKGRAVNVMGGINAALLAS